MRMRLAAIGLAGFIVFGGNLQAQAPPKASTLARYFPASDLVAYVEFDGLDAHSEGWKKTSTYRLLTETTTGAMLEEMLVQAVDRLTAETPPPAKMTGKEFVAMVKQSLKAGFAMGVNRHPGEPKPYSIGVVLRKGAGGEARVSIARLIDAMNPPGSKAMVVTKTGDRKVIVVEDRRKSGFAWWSEGEDLVFNLAPQTGPDAMIATLEGKAANATESPVRQGLVKTVDNFEPVFLAYLDMAALPSLPPQAASLGLDRIKRIDYRWGFQDDALMTITRLVAPSPRSGVLALLEQPTFRLDGLPPMPEGIDGFTAVAFDPDAFFAKAREVAVAMDRQADRGFRDMTDAFRQITGLRLREDLLKHLGPNMTTYTVPTRGKLPTNPFYGFAQGYVHVPKTTMLIEVRDPDGFAASLDVLAKKGNEILRAQVGQDPDVAEKIGLIPLKGPEKGFLLSLPPSMLPLPAGMRPTLLLGKKYLAIGTTPDVARKALAVQENPAAGLEKRFGKALNRLPKGMTMLSVGDARESILPDVIANLPGLISLVNSGGSPAMNPFFLGRMLGGLPVRPGGGAPGLQIQIDPELIPDPEALRPFLSTSFSAFTVDDEGFQFIARESFPSVNPATAVPFAMAALLPAVQASRAAARRSQSVNNLKQIGLAFHNFTSSNNNFPADIRDKDGKPLLSWRVQLLPFLEQQALFNEFRMDEAWDSPHNKALLANMPTTFMVPGSSADPGMTFYRGFSGKSTALDATMKQPLGFHMVTDGTSNTLFATEAKEAVPWTKPDSDLALDADAKPEEGGKAMLNMLGGHFAGGFNTLFLDGSVRFIKQTVNPNVLRALITRDQGEVISSDSF